MILARAGTRLHGRRGGRLPGGTLTWSPMRRPALLLAAAFLAGLLAGACSQRVTPEEEFSETDRERPLIDPSQLPPGMAEGGAAPAAAPMRGGAASEGAASEPAADAIRGTIALPEGESAGSATLFVFVRAPGVTGGPPLAVQRWPGSALPLEYAIGSESAMMGGGSLPDEVVVQARLDADGNAMTTGEGDRSAQSEPVAPGSTGVDLTLSK